jgi:tetratricopeptide (TPR) repeat protein
MKSSHRLVTFIITIGAVCGYIANIFSAYEVWKKYFINPLWGYTDASPAPELVYICTFVPVSIIVISVVLLIGYLVGYDKQNSPPPTQPKKVPQYTSSVLGLPAAPSPPDSFTGRQEEYARLMQRLRSKEDQNTVTAIYGMDGIGKTALAKKIAHKLGEAFPGGVIWTDLRDYQGDMMRVLKSWAEKLGQNVDALTNPHERIGVVRDLLAAQKAKVGYLIIILDDVWNEHQKTARELLSEARPSGTPALLTTSNVELANALADKAEPLLLLTSDQALELLAKVAGKELVYKDEIVARSLVRIVGYLPLAIEIAGKLALEYSRRPNWQLASLRDEIQAGADKFFANTSFGERGLAATFALSYDALTSEQQRIFCLLAVLTTTPFNARQVAIIVEAHNRGRFRQKLYLKWRSLLKDTVLVPFISIAPDRIEQISEELAALEKMSLIQLNDVNSAAPYSLHPLLRQYATKKLGEIDKKGHIPTLYRNYYLAYAEAHSRLSPEDFAALDDELPHILAAMSRAYREEQWEQVIVFVGALDNPQAPYLNRRGYYSELRTCLQQGIHAAEKIRDQNSLAVFSGNLATILKNSGEVEEARITYQQVRDIFEEVENYEDAAKACYFLGQLEQNAGNLVEAAPNYKRAKNYDLEPHPPIPKYLRWLLRFAKWRGTEANIKYLYQRLGIAERTPEKGIFFIILRSLGELAEASGNFDEARQYYRQALDKAEQINHMTEASQALRKLGELAAYEEDYAEAHLCYQKITAISKELWHAADRVSVVNDLARLAHIMKDYRLAKQHWEHSLKLYRTLADNAGMAASARQLSYLLLQMKNYKEAKLMYERSLNFYREAALREKESLERSLNLYEVLANKAGIAASARELGAVLRQLEDYKGAELEYERSLRLYKGMKDQRSIANLQEEWGGLAQEIGHSKEAEQRYQQSAAIWQHIGELQRYAATLIELGKISYNNGDFSSTRKLCEQSLAIYRERDSKNDIAAVLLHAGQAAWVEGAVTTAERYYQESQAIFAVQHNQAGLAAISEEFGLMAQVQGEYNKASGFYKQSLQLYDTLQDQVSRARLLNQEAELARIQGNYEVANQLHRDSQEINETIRDKSGVAAVLFGLATLAEVRGAFSEAEQLLQQSLKTYRELDWKLLIAETLNRLSSLMQIQGLYPKAEELFQESQDLIEHFSKSFYRASFDIQKGRLAEDRAEYDQARHIYEQTLTIVEQQSALLDIANITGLLGQLDYITGLYAEARKRYEKSLSIYQKLGVRPGIAEVTSLLGRLAIDEGNYTLGQKQLDESLELHKQLNHNFSIGINLRHLGVLAKKQGDFAKAKELYSQSLTISRNLNAPKESAETLYELGLLAQATGDTATAEAMYRDSLTLYQSLGLKSPANVIQQQMDILFKQD